MRNWRISLVLLKKYITMHGPVNVKLIYFVLRAALFVNRLCTTPLPNGTIVVFLCKLLRI